MKLSLDIQRGVGIVKRFSNPQTYEGLRLKAKKPAPIQQPLSDNARKLILKHEGFHKTPGWPGEQSGVSIGIGYDLGYTTADVFKADWVEVLTAKQIKILLPVVGLKGAKAKAALKKLDDVKIPIKGGEKVFFERSLPKYIVLTENAFPGIGDLPPDAQGALVSLVYNRGTSMTGESRKEMKEIRDLIPKKDLTGIAAQIRSMKRLWDPESGLIKRREDEAKMIEKSK